MELMFKVHKKIEQANFLKKFGRWAPIIGVLWLGSHIFVPLALLRIPVFHDYLLALASKLPFTIPGIG